MLDIGWLRVSTNVMKGFGHVSFGTADGCFGEGYTVDLVVAGAAALRCEVFFTVKLGVSFRSCDAIRGLLSAALRCEVFFTVKLGVSFGSCDAIRGLLSAAHGRCGWYIARKSDKCVNAAAEHLQRRKGCYNPDVKLFQSIFVRCRRSNRRDKD